MSKAATGFVFDFGSDRSILRSASLEEQVKHSIRATLLTRRGECALQPQFGSELYRYLFRPLSQGLILEMQNEVREAVTRNEPRVRVTEVEISQDSDHPDVLDLRIQFEYRANAKTGLMKVQFHA